MAQDAYPVPGRATTFAEFRAYARTYAGDRIADGLTVFADSTGRQVKVRPGKATVDGIFYQSTAQETLIIAPNTAQTPRVDAIVLRLNPAGTPLVQLAVLEGTPGQTPQPPALATSLVGVYELLLATVNVPAGAVTIAAGQVTLADAAAAVAGGVEKRRVSVVAGNSQGSSSGIHWRTFTIPFQREFPTPPLVELTYETSSTGGPVGWGQLASVSKTNFVFRSIQVGLASFPAGVLHYTATEIAQTA